jgi:hypothetical protein
MQSSLKIDGDDVHFEMVAADDRTAYGQKLER